MTRVLVTSFDGKYFKAGLTLIAAAHRTSWDVVDRILVYDLGLSDEQKRLLGRCEKVRVMPYPDVVGSFFDGYLEPGQFAWKPCAIKYAGQHGSHIFWLDAGAMPVQNLGVVFDRIERDDIFLVQDENLTARLTRERAFQLMEADVAERNSRMLCAGILGYKAGGRYQGLIDKAFLYSQNPEIVRGSLDSHRHDQSIYSVLAIRHKCPTQSLRVFGECGGLRVHPDQVIYVHRGKHHDISGLKVKWGKELSVCLTTFNATATIERVLGSLAGQSDVGPAEWEVIVVDNNSTDGTSDKALAFGPRVPCVFKVFREELQGSYFARRRAALEAEGRILAVLDDDMILDKRWVRRCLDFFDAHRTAGIVCSRIEVETDATVPACWNQAKWMFGARDYMGDTESVVDVPGQPVEQPCGGGTAMLALAALQAYLAEPFVMKGRVGKDIGWCEDMELAWRIVRQGWESWYAPGLMSIHLIPARRLTEQALLRLRSGICEDGVLMDTLQTTGFYPPGRKYALRQCWWACAAAWNRMPVFFRKDLDSRFRCAGLKGRLRGTLRQLVESIR